MPSSISAMRGGARLFRPRASRVRVPGRGQGRGILANATYPADFIREPIDRTQVIDAAHRAGVQRLLFLGSSCIYPRGCPQPMKEESLLSGPLKPTNRPPRTLPLRERSARISPLWQSAMADLLGQDFAIEANDTLYRCVERWRAHMEAPFVRLYVR